MSVALFLAVAAYSLAGELLPRGSLALALVSDLGFVLMQVVVLILCCRAVGQAHTRLERHLWGWLAAWTALNLFADGAWAYYELIRRVDPPEPGIPDIGYLASYFMAFGGIAVLAFSAAGKYRAVETVLDSLIFTTGITALFWPLVLEPLLEASQSPAEFWVTLAYPVGDLLVILAIVSLVLGTWSTGRIWPRYHVLLVSLAFVVQTGADCAYFVVVARGGEYGPGSLLDPIWLLAFALVGAAAVRGRQASIQTERGATQSSVPDLSQSPAAEVAPWTSSLMRFLRVGLPYFALPMLAGSFVIQVVRGWHSILDAELLFVASLILGLLILTRQYVAMRHNRLLAKELQATQSELENEIRSLSELTQRLESLNHHLERLQRLRSVPEIASVALELACAYEGSPGGWITMDGGEGQSQLIASWGAAKQSTLDSRTAGGEVGDKTAPRIINLESGGRTLGRMYLLPGERPHPEPDMLPAIAAHIATALDNASRYEEAIDLAEKDPLTGLYNRRGIYKRLAGELLRAQKQGTPLAIILADLDNFKYINDTFGHPAGDGALRHIAQRILSALRHADLAGRIGGDELLLVLPKTSGEGARQVARRLLEEIANSPYPVVGDYYVPLKLSLGIATYPDDGQSLNELIKRADVNLYLSKQVGGNVVSGGGKAQPAGRACAGPATTDPRPSADPNNLSARDSNPELQGSTAS
ncbi:MAG: diguanylate cyclase [Thermoleophilia bacterium]|nr:diguanylate cyclase [Thermoleophilia bacterium]